MDKPFTNIVSKSEYIRRKRNLTRSRFLKKVGGKGTSNTQNYQNKNFKMEYTPDLSRKKLIYFKNNTELLELTKSLIEDLKDCSGRSFVNMNEAIVDCSQIYYTTSISEGLYSVVDCANRNLESETTCKHPGILQRGTIPKKYVKKNIYFDPHSKYR